MDTASPDLVVMGMGLGREAFDRESQACILENCRPPACRTEENHRGRAHFSLSLGPDLCGRNGCRVQWGWSRTDTYSYPNAHRCTDADAQPIAESHTYAYAYSNVDRHGPSRFRVRQPGRRQHSRQGHASDRFPHGDRVRQGYQRAGEQCRGLQDQLVG